MGNNKKRGVGGVTKSLFTKIKIMLWMVVTDIKRRFGKNEPVGIMVGTNVESGQISLRTQMSNGSYVAVCMTPASAKEIMHEMQMALNAVRFKGKIK